MAPLNLLQGRAGVHFFAEVYEVYVVPLLMLQI